MSYSNALPNLIWIARTVVGATLLLSSLSKLRDVDAFVSGALAYRVVDGRIVAYGAWMVPWAEAALGAAMLAGWATRAAAIGAIGLMSVFAVAAAAAIVRGMKIPCHCFGAEAHDMVGVGTLVRLFILIALAAVVAVTAGDGGFRVGHLSAEDIVGMAGIAIVGVMALVYSGTIEAVARAWWQVRLAAIARANHAARVAELEMEGGS